MAQQPQRQRPQQWGYCDQLHRFQHDLDRWVKPGKSAYQVAVEYGYKGTVQDWLASLQGAAGTNGTNGINGTNGLTNYELALANGYIGTLAQWLATQVGPPGANGTNGTNGVNGVTPQPNTAAAVVAQTSTSTFFPTALTAGVEAIGTAYTAPGNGWVVATINPSSQTGTSAISYTLDGNTFVWGQGSVGPTLPATLTLTAPVAAGDLVTLGATSATASTVTYATPTQLQFVPYK